MGCDIHVHIEVQDKTGKWHHYGAPHIKRDYALFALMAGVQNYDYIQPIVAPRGMPDDISMITDIEWKTHICDWHTPSYLMAVELPELQQRYRDLRAEMGYLESDLEFKVFHTYVLGNSLASHEGWENLRIVFWFDN